MVHYFLNIKGMNNEKKSQLEKILPSFDGICLSSRIGETTYTFKPNLSDRDLQKIVKIMYNSSIPYWQLTREESK